jgi:hypothetical protein
MNNISKLMFPDVEFKKLLVKLAENQYFKELTNKNMLTDDCISKTKERLQYHFDESKDARLIFICDEYFLKEKFGKSAYRILFNKKWDDTKLHIENIIAEMKKCKEI